MIFVEDMRENKSLICEKTSVCILLLVENLLFFLEHM